MKSRDLLIKGLEKFKDLIQVIPSQGGYFFIADISNLASKLPEKYKNFEKGECYACFQWLAIEIGVNFIPLESFYQTPSKGRFYMRLSCCVKPENIEEALKRLQKIRNYN